MNKERRGGSDILNRILHTPSPKQWTSEKTMFYLILLPYSIYKIFHIKQTLSVVLPVLLLLTETLYCFDPNLERKWPTINIAHLFIVRVIRSHTKNHFICMIIGGVSNTIYNILILIWNISFTNILHICHRLCIDFKGFINL